MSGVIRTPMHPGSHPASQSRLASGAVAEPWSRDSWRALPAGHQPEYGDPARVASVLRQIESYPPLVSPGEIRALRRQLAEAEVGRRFLLQGGDCAERFADCTPEAINGKISQLLRFGLILTGNTGLPVVKVGRIAGQYAKPRSVPYEDVDGRRVPAFRGDSVHDFDTRLADPGRLLQAYHAASLTLNYIRSLVADGFTGISRVRDWTHGVACDRFDAVAGSIQGALDVAAKFGATSLSHDATDIFASHEGLVLDFEQAMTREDPETRVPFNLSAHMLWIGERTRNIGGAHVEYFRGIANPVGVKIGGGAVAAEIAELVRILNPARERGKVVLITRLGAKNVEAELPGLIEAVRGARTPVLWCCDPMHGNTVRSASGLKTRHMRDISRELELTVAIHAGHRSRLGGVHLEMTGSDVTECAGTGVSADQIPLRYETYCDPRLNATQSMELAHQLSGFLAEP